MALCKMPDGANANKHAMNTHLYPETCIALKPDYDTLRGAIMERSLYNSWAVELANILGVPFDGLSIEDMTERYAELRERITEVVKGLKA